MIFVMKNHLTIQNLLKQPKMLHEQIQSEKAEAGLLRIGIKG